MKNLNKDRRDTRRELDKLEDLEGNLKEDLKLIRSIDSKETHQLRGKIKGIHHLMNRAKLKLSRLKQKAKLISIRKSRSVEE